MESLCCCLQHCETDSIHIEMGEVVLAENNNLLCSLPSAYMLILLISAMAALLTSFAHLFVVNNRAAQAI